MGAGGGGCLKPRLVLGDATAQSGSIGVNGQREAASKTQVTLDGQAKWQRHRRNFGKAGRPHFRATKAKVAKTELDDDGDTLFGLCDLGFGCPEMGSASLAEIAAVTLPFGLTIERDLHFEGRFPLTVYADAARLCGGITEDEARLEAAAAARAQEDSALPPP